MSRSRESPKVAASAAFSILAAFTIAAALAPACRSSSPVSMVSGPPLMAAPSPSVSPVLARAPRAPSARTEKECQACRGSWAKHGLSETTACNCRTRDAGKRCRDGVECEGQCVLGEVPERTAADASGRRFYVGRCSELVTVFGCVRFLPKGAAATAAGEPQDPLPPMICVD